MSKREREVEVEFRVPYIERCCVVTSDAMDAMRKLLSNFVPRIWRERQRQSS
jgi:hypothetical protein